MSADVVGDGLLGFRLGSSLGLRGKREDSCVLPFIEPRQQHDVPIGELECVMIDVKRALVDLAKDRNGVAGIGSKRDIMRAADALENKMAPVSNKFRDPN